MRQDLYSIPDHTPHYTKLERNPSICT